MEESTEEIEIEGVERSSLNLSYSTEATSDGCLADTSASLDTEDTDVDGEVSTSRHLHPRFSRRAGSAMVSQARERAKLLCAQGRILQLETGVARLERAAKRARVVEEGEEEGRRKAVRDSARLHKVKNGARVSGVVGGVCSYQS